ncbi:WecB/TagA/CpsF family glycosyltransferase [Shewanella benthica]|uniref:Bacterial sugar transferase/glycosyl transferase, WecB/TagA/CpsF family protein n=1 Tax=Shewanella benthica KT99 TaxID=314608 RepID=A9D4C7_9GAMM|nr:WecB/TagA/CpsF family glycosyltransferase [Shewanella benthica]EDQ01536.1 bacterial sugar transferase/glycosyl transferase, WecB/TagA/CpsF family protein [Shewanella benthica KT99]
MITNTQVETANIRDHMLRTVDIILALLLIISAAPVLVFKSLYRKYHHGSAIERVYIHDAKDGKIGLYQFTGEGRCCQWPYLINLLKGDLSLLGSDKRYYLEPEQGAGQPSYHHLNNQRISKPGLLSFEQMHHRLGINFEDKAAHLHDAQSNLLSYLMAASRIVLTSIFSAHKANSSAQSIPLFNLQLCNLTMKEMLAEIIIQCQHYQALKLTRHPDTTHSGTGHSLGMLQYAFVNAACLNLSVKDPLYRRCLQSSCHKIFADGSGIRIACLWKGYSPKDNLNGTDMFPRLCEQLSKNNLSVFLLGGAPGIAAKTAENMSRQYPNLAIAGTHHGYLDSLTNEQSVIEQINASGASVLLVAMGAPRQEVWLEKHQAHLDVAVGIGVGGLFDFYSEKIIRAPLWVRQIGMEWVCRLAEEPKRMWQRYILGNPLFLYRVLQEIRQQKQHRHPIISAAQTTKDPLLTDSIYANKLEDSGTNKHIQHPNLTNQHSLNAQAKQRCKRNRALARFNIHLKRGLDLFCAALLLVLLLPLLLCVSLLIRLESKGPVLFSQQRAGKHNIPFTMWKFRSMYPDAELRRRALQSANEMQGGILFKMKQDPRITRIGKVIRKLSIDELPQLCNVICGDMSLVGPRPALLAEVEQYSLHDRRRLAVKPGITCIWQVSGRSDIPFDRQVELDVDYIYQQSFFTDVSLLIKTIPAVIFARGAY